MSPSNREAVSAIGERRGSQAMNRFVRAAANRNKAISDSSGNWCKNKLAIIISAIGPDCFSQAKISVVALSMDQLSAANARRVSIETRFWRSSKMTSVVKPIAAEQRASRNSKVPSPAPSSTIRNGRGRKEVSASWR